ncbi:MAG: glutathione transferase GstA [Geminicoccaceae bacterium]
MKLYYSPGACSLSPHIALREAGLPFELVKVDLKGKVTEHGDDFRKVNPKGAVPALQLDDGHVLTEGAAIVQYVADRKPEARLAPAAGSIDRYRLQEALNFVASEIHKGFAPLFYPGYSDDAKALQKASLRARLDYLEGELKNRPYLTGDHYTVADGYLFVVLGWTGYVGLDLADWPTLKAYHARIAGRPAVQAALKAEGLAG